MTDHTIPSDTVVEKITFILYDILQQKNLVPKFLDHKNSEYVC